MLGTAIALGIVTIAESSIGIFVKLVGDQVPILSLNFYRVFFAAVVLLPLITIFGGNGIRFPRHNIRDILIVGALIAMQISLFNVAMTLAPVANVVIFWSIAPFFVFIFSSLFLKEKPRPIYILIFALAFIGIVIAEPVSISTLAFSGEQLGNILALITGVVYAALVTYLRSEGKTEATIDIFWFMLMACIYLSPAVLIFGTGDLFAMSTTTSLTSVPVWVWVVALGMFSTGLSFFCISFVLKRINANIYSLIDIIFSPIVAGIFALIIFGEQPTTETIVGGSILLTSGALLTMLRYRHIAKPHVEQRIRGK